MNKFQDNNRRINENNEATFRGYQEQNQQTTQEISNNTIELQKNVLIQINHHMLNSLITSINPGKISRFQKDILKHTIHSRKTYQIIQSMQQTS